MDWTEQTPQATGNVQSGRVARGSRSLSLHLIGFELKEFRFAELP